MHFLEQERMARVGAWVAERIGGRVEAAAILGSGFAPLLDLLTGQERLGFGEVEGLAGCTAPGHAAEIAAGILRGRRYLFFSGRLHLYEGRSAGEVAAPVALARALGADRIVLTCAAGATSPGLPTGGVVLVEDHLNLTGENPLLGVPIRERFPPFLPMGDAYDPAALAAATRLAATLPEGARRGVLASLPGPCFETPAEYRALARLGADVVSMSCVLETIAARALGMRVLALAIVANGPARPGTQGATADEVLAVVEGSVRSRLDFFRDLLADFASDKPPAARDR